MKPAIHSKNLGWGFLAAATLAGGIVACSHSTTKTQPVPGAPVARYVPEREVKTDVKSSYKLPPFEEKLLDNGLRVLFVPEQSLPYVSYTMLVRVGSIQDPEGLNGLSAMVAELIDKGTKRRSAPQIAADLGQMGADFDANAANEFSIINASSLSSQADLLLKNLIEIVTEPTFSDVEIERVRKQTLSAIERQEDNADAFSERAFDEFLFGTHPYANSPIGNLATVGHIKKKNIIQHYLHYYRPNNTLLAVVGKYSPEFAAKVVKEFGAWQPREVAPQKLPPPPTVTGLQIELVDKPGLVQAQIHMGNIGIGRQDPEYLALRVANTILGGAFASRLVDRVRKDLGLTYSISSSFDARQQPGPFQISTFTKNVTVGQTVTETLSVVDQFRQKGVSEGEVQQAKGYLKGVFPTAIETAEKLAFNLLLLRYYDVPDTYLTNYLNDIDSLKASDINRAIQSHIDSKNIKVLVYTSAAEAQAQLQKVSTDLGGQLTVKKASEFQ